MMPENARLTERGRILCQTSACDFPIPTLPDGECDLLGTAAGLPVTQAGFDEWRGTVMQILKQLTAEQWLRAATYHGCSVDTGRNRGDILHLVPTWKAPDAETYAVWCWAVVALLRSITLADWAAMADDPEPDAVPLEWLVPDAQKAGEQSLAQAALLVQPAPAPAPVPAPVPTASLVQTKLIPQLPTLPPPPVVCSPPDMPATPGARRRRDKISPTAASDRRDEEADVKPTPARAALGSPCGEIATPGPATPAMSDYAHCVMNHATRLERAAKSDPDVARALAALDGVFVGFWDRTKTGTTCADQLPQLGEDCTKAHTKCLGVFHAARALGHAPLGLMNLFFVVDARGERVYQDTGTLDIAQASPRTVQEAVWVGSAARVCNGAHKFVSSKLRQMRIDTGAL